MTAAQLESPGIRRLAVRTDDAVELAGIAVPAPAPLPHAGQAAGPAATVWVVPGFGHAESGATAPLVERSGRWASATIDP